MTVCLFVCLFVCYVFVTNVTKLNISAKWSQIFTKLFAYFRIGLLSLFIMCMSMHVHACSIVHKQPIQIWMQLWPYFCTFLLLFCQFIVIMKILPDWKWKKMEAMFQVGINVTQIFCLLFFSFSVWKSSKMVKTVQIMVKIPLLFTPGG